MLHEQRKTTPTLPPQPSTNRKCHKSNKAPKYQTAYACEGKKLTIECDPGDLINLIRANYGRFSITICNNEGNVDWSVNCMFPKSLTVLNSRCSHKQSCSVLATTSMFGDPCPGTHKYLEAHYQCISAAQTSTTTNRPSPPWLLTNTPPLLANGSTLVNTAGQPAVAPPPARHPPLPVGGAVPHSTPGTPTLHTTLPGGRLKGDSANASTTKSGLHHDSLPAPPPLHTHHHHGGAHHAEGKAGEAGGVKATTAATNSSATAGNTRIMTGVGGVGSDDSTTKHAQQRGQQAPAQAAAPVGSTTASAVPTAAAGGNMSGVGGVIRTINNINNLNSGLVAEEDDSQLYCGPSNARNLFWNVTRVGDVNVQPCPGGATGIAKWRCVLMKRLGDLDDDLGEMPPRVDCAGGNSSGCETPQMLAKRMQQRLRHFEPTWHPITPDLTQCRSLWLNNLEVRVNQRDSSLISIANDLSEVTSSKTLYGGDMLVTTKIIQTMSEKMFHDKETFPDQRQREAIILELLHGVVKTGSNLLDESQLSSWLDLNQEDQMRVATSLLTGLEYNAFLLADTIIRERNVVQKVKNILLSVRVLEAKNIQSNEVFPDAEQWQISDDRIELPRAALVENSEGGLVRIVFAAFDRLESILKPSYDHFDMKSARSYVRNTAILANDSGSGNLDAQQPQRIRILNSKVISASLGKGRHIQLSQPIRLVLRHLKTENVSNPTCVFWNYIDHAWSANGCNLESSNRTHSVCTCNHLTNFAILMDVQDEHNQSLFTMFDGNMRILIYISIAICFVFIVIALLTLKIFNGVFIKSARTSIYRSIYVCLLLIELLFLCGIEQSGEPSIFCGFTTVFLHCAILAAIAWFCFEAFQSYSTLTTDDMLLLEGDQTAKVNCYYLLSYGLSLTVVAISLAINPRTYTQNDFCVLMEANALFYASFVTPVVLFFLAAVGYTLLSWLIMCRKSRTTLKNKEHTRLANVRFDIRCSFIFLLLMSAVWLTAYYYLRYAKMDDEAAIVYGYLFVSFNTLMGLYIFVFHCIQNEKIRREYRKYVRQNSWLPKCLRCSKTSISSGIVGNNGATVGGAAASGTLNSQTAGTQLKKSKLTGGTEAMLVSDETGGIIAAGEDAIIASSDCELNDAAQPRRNNVGGTLKSVGIMPGSLVLQHGKANSIIDSMQGHIVLERGGGGIGGGASSGTLRSTGAGSVVVAATAGGGGIHTPSAGHTSPTSSAGSTHLIFGHGHKQQVAATGGGMSAVTEAYYHQPDYYSWKQATGGKGYNGTAGQQQQQQPPQGQPHEFFYWTQKHNQHGKKKRGGGGGGSDSPSGSLHSRNTAASQQILFYPSYKKTTLKQQQQQQQQQQYQQPYAHYAEAVEPHAPAYYQQQQLRRQQLAQQQAPYQQQQQQLSSDEEQIGEAAAHAHLLHLSRRAAGQQQLPTPPHGYAAGEFAAAGVGGGGGYHARYYNRNKHSNCDLNGEYRGSEPYYNQGSLSGSGGDGPVYEEILSNRNSDVGVGGVGGAGSDFAEDERVRAIYESERNGLGGAGGDYMESMTSLGRRVAMRRATAAAASRQQQRAKQQQQKRRVIDDDDDDDDDEEDEEEEEAEESVCDDDDDEVEDDEELENAAQLGLQQSDERMRRLMAMQDEDFQRRFQRQLRKNGSAAADGVNVYHDYDAQQKQQQQQQQQQHPSVQQPTVFGISGGAGNGGSTALVVRAFKKPPTTASAAATTIATTAVANNSPNHQRMAINELFPHGPPLPPANQHPMQKRQQPQQQQQQLSPQSITSNTSASSHLNSHTHPHAQQQLQPQQQQPRNISAMLDENNTVRCYLEPLSK